MATELVSAEDISISMDSNGWTRQRKKIISGKDIEEILASGMLPSRGSSHPENTRYKLDSANCEVIGNANRDIQLLWTGTYISRSGSGGGTVGGDNEQFNDESNNTQDKTPPWDMGAQNVAINSYQVQKPFTSGYDIENDYRERQLINSAGSVILANTSKWGRELTFTFCEKNKRAALATTAPSVNSKTIIIAGVEIKALCGLLFPISCRKIIDRDDYGNETRSYYEYSVKIHIDGLEWEHRLKDVGTLIKDNNGELSPIYRYKAWQTDYTEEQKLKERWKYGTITDVIVAKGKYAGNVGSSDDINKKTEYWSKWQELPFDEMTEPMPLTADGKLDEVAMAQGNYREIKLSEYKAVSWSSYGFPKAMEVD